MHMLAGLYAGHDGMIKLSGMLLPCTDTNGLHTDSKGWDVI